MKDLKGKKYERKGCQRIKDRKPENTKILFTTKKENLGCPVVSSVNCHTSNISKYVDYHLQPIVKEIPSHVKDAKDFIQELNQIEQTPEDNLLDTFDVKSLHTNIPNNEGIKAVMVAYDKHPNFHPNLF